MTQYDYTINPCAVDRLSQEIQLSAISSATLSYINLFGSLVSIFFDNALSGGDQTILDAIVAAHTGVGLATDFIKVSATTTTSTSNSSYTALDTMQTPPLVAGTYLVFFKGNFKTNVPLLSQPGVVIGIFDNGSLIADSEVTDISTDSGGLFDMLTITQVTVPANKIVEVKWKTNGQGNTITCINRILCLVRQK